MDIRVEFTVQPVRTHDMEYACDQRKDKPIRGMSGNHPIVRIVDPLRRPGKLKVVSVSHTPISNSKYNLHPNILCNEKKKEKRCDDFGIATYSFNNKSGEVNIALEDICVRHSSKKSAEEFKKKWQNYAHKFDPFEVGFGDLKEVNLEYIRLCCQVFFENGIKSKVAISDPIFNGPSGIKIEYWDDQRRVNVDGNETLYVLVRKVSNEQREIVAKFYDNNGWVEDVEPIYNHHDCGFVFKIPTYTKNIDEATECNVKLFVKTKDYYESEVKKFMYVSYRQKRSFMKTIENEPEIIDVKKTHKFPVKKPRFNKTVNIEQNGSSITKSVTNFKNDQQEYNGELTVLPNSQIHFSGNIDSFIDDWDINSVFNIINQANSNDSSNQSETFSTQMETDGNLNISHFIATSSTYNTNIVNDTTFNIENSNIPFQQQNVCEYEFNPEEFLNMTDDSNNHSEQLTNLNCPNTTIDSNSALENFDLNLINLDEIDLKKLDEFDDDLLENVLDGPNINF